MPDQGQIGQNPGADAPDDQLDRLFAEARSAPVAGLPPALMQRLLADAAALQPRAGGRAPVSASPLAVFWAGLQDVFGGKRGLAGASFALCAAFAVGAYLPDTTADWIGLPTVTDLAALEMDADPAVLWAEE